MTLYDLANGTTIQGKIRLSRWRDDDETVLLELDNVEDLYSAGIEKYENMKVDYVFAGTDGFLHIELAD